jgi:4-hydroxyacetophenone monooxygenase
MTVQWDISLRDITDDQLRQALAQAHVPALMGALVHLTSSGEHLRGEIRPIVEQLAEEEDGLDEDLRNQARTMAFDVLRIYRDAGCPDLPAPDDELVVETMHYVTGTPIPPEQMELMREELNLYGEDRRRVPIDRDAIPADYRVLVIGAGMSGILAAVRLKEAGISFLVVDKNPEIGGTWYENTYPGCQVDSANHLYNYIFAPETQWPGHFSGQPELFDYFKGVVRDQDLRPCMRLGVAVEGAAYDEDDDCWAVTFCDGAGRQSQERFDTVIAACGQLNTPALPDIPGVESFSGIAFHSARWEHEHDLGGKRVAVIGTGCSAAQFVPAIADKTAGMFVFQRSAPWLLPTEKYHMKVSEEERWCFRGIPFYARWYRFFLFRARACDGLLPFLYGDPGWQGSPGSVGTANALLREAIEESIREQAGDDEELADALIPDYPPGGKRPVLDDGQWISTLRKDHVTLVTEPINRIEEKGIRTADGTLFEVDAVIYGTGFKADRFLVPMRITGRGGLDLHQAWHGNPRAYMGMTIPGFPNFYCLYGPNTNIVVGSSIIFGSECEMRYIMGCLRLQFEQHIASLEVREDRWREYNDDIDARSRQCAWGSPHVDSWYKNDAGRVSQNWPGTHFEWWQQTRAPDPEDFVRPT